MFETGIKVIDLIAPYQRVARLAFLVELELVKPFLFKNLSIILQKNMVGYLYLQEWGKEPEKVMTFIMK